MRGQVRFLEKAGLSFFFGRAARRPMYATVRCPNPECAAVFDLAVERLGRNVYCLECGKRMTAKRTDLDAALRDRQRQASGGDGATIERLPLVVVVENVRSLWNVGSIFRTADGCGVAKLFLTGITGTPPRKEISKTALGADEVVAWEYHAQTSDAVDAAAAESFEVVTLESTSSATPIDEFEWPSKTCLVLGNEVDGVSPSSLARSEHHVSIPMAGVKESFNVAVAFGIAVHAASRGLAKRNPGVRFR